MLSLMNRVIRAYEIVAAYMACSQGLSVPFEVRSKVFDTYFHVPHELILSHFPQVISSAVDAHCQMSVSTRTTSLLQVSRYVQSTPEIQYATRNNHENTVRSARLN